MNVVFEFDNGRVVDLRDYPPAPVVWFTNSLDTLLWNAPWRSWLGVTNSPLLGEAFILPPFSSMYPPFLSFQEYRHQHDDTSATWWESLWGYASTPSTQIIDFSTATGFLTLFLVWIVFRTIKSYALPCFSRLGRWAAQRSHGSEWIAANEIRITKFGEYVFRLLFHSAMSWYGVHYFLNEPWWKDPTGEVFDKYPYQEVSVPMIWYYVLQAAYNLDAFISLLQMSLTFRDGRLTWSETKRGDFWEMLAHHVATNLLVFGSSGRRFHRAGSMVFFVHDVSDITVDLSKLANFLKWKITTIVCFLVMTVNWVVTRLYILPFVIYKTTLTKSHILMAEGASPLHFICYRHFFYVIFGLLIALHFLWFLMFLRILSAMIMKFEVHDYSEHKKGEKQTAETDKKKA